MELEQLYSVLVTIRFYFIMLVLVIFFFSFVCSPYLLCHVERSSII